MTDSMLNLTQMSNIGVPGQFIFRVDERDIKNAGEYIPDKNRKQRYDYFKLLPNEYRILYIVFSHCLTLTGVYVFIYVLYLCVHVQNKKRICSENKC